MPPFTIMGFAANLSLGYRVADDFTVPAGQTWQIASLTFFAYQVGSTTTSTINHVNFRVWNGRPGDAGSLVVYGDASTNQLASSQFTGILRSMPPTYPCQLMNRPIMAANVCTPQLGPLVLPAGTYWLDWQIGGTLANGPYVPPITILGQLVTGNGRQGFPSGAWIDLRDTVYPQGLPFILQGDDGTNQPPVVTAGQTTVSINEGQTATNSGGVSDPDGDPVTLSASVGAIVNNGDGTWSWSFLAADGPAASQTVTITGDDGRGGIAMATFALDVANVAPTVTAIAVPLDPVNINNQPVSASATFSDPAGTADEDFTCTFDYGDLSEPVAGTVIGTTCTGPDHTYASAGVYAVTVAVRDKDNGVGSATCTTYIVIYDPSEGFVTGGGWIESPAGAYPANPDLAGRANFGFVSRYQRGQSVPDGNTVFHFQAGDFRFQSTLYDWLVVAGPHAKYKGSGQVNNAGNYGFMLTARDSEVNGGGVTDLFRIKIWMQDAEETVIYDNQMGEDDTGYAGTALAGGQIKIQNGGAARPGEGDEPDVVDMAIPTAYALLQSTPNPFNPATEIRFDLPEATAVRLVVYNTLGRVVARLVDGALPPGQHRVTFEGTGLPSGRYFYRIEAGSFSETRSMTLTK